MYRESNGVWAGMVLAVALLGAAPQPHPGVASTVNVKLSEWNVVLSQASVGAGPVTFVITNAGSIPHGLEVEGRGIEQEIETIQPGASDTLTLTLTAGSYDVYCPVGEDSHKKLGMDRVQTKDVPHHPRFGGVIMGLFYHGVTQVHTPLVPTINSAVAL